MTGAYLPACAYCRTGEPTYRIACQGCQARRAVAMAAYQKSAGPLPNSSKPLPPVKIAP